MKKQLILTTVALVVSLLFLSGLAMAAPEGTVHLNWGYYLHDGGTACPSGKPVINVNRKVINSLDSGFGKNQWDARWWATSDFNQNIKVVEIDGGYCATVTYRGKVESVEGDGPGCNTDLNDDCGDMLGLAAGVTGTFHGGYTANITPADGFNPNDLPTRGNLDTVDPDCNPMDNNPATACDFSASFAWIQDYFPGTNFSLIWWGWVYHAGKNGTWVNAETPPGSSGNITGD